MHPSFVRFMKCHHACLFGPATGGRQCDARRCERYFSTGRRSTTCGELRYIKSSLGRDFSKCVRACNNATVPQADLLRALHRIRCARTSRHAHSASSGNSIMSPMPAVSLASVNPSMPRLHGGKPAQHPLHTACSCLHRPANPATGIRRRPMNDRAHHDG
jgi:hypothetical protein